MTIKIKSKVNKSYSRWIQNFEFMDSLFHKRPLLELRFKLLNSVELVTRTLALPPTAGVKSYSPSLGMVCPLEW